MQKQSSFRVNSVILNAIKDPGSFYFSSVLWSDFDFSLFAPYVYKMVATDPSITSLQDSTHRKRKEDFFLSHVLLEKTIIYRHPQQISYQSPLAKEAWDSFKCFKIYLRKWVLLKM